MEILHKQSNLHTHCMYDDGHGPLEEYVLKALSLNFEAIGFACHAPMPFEDDGHIRHDQIEEYLQTIRDLRSAYGNRIEIYAGLELDYLEMSDTMAGFEYVDRLDFTIGSLHVMYCDEEYGYRSIDYKQEDFERILERRFHADIKAMVTHYWHVQQVMVEHHQFDIFGHCDAIKKLNKDNRYFDPQADWYQALAASFIESAAKHHVRLEVNTGGLARGKTTEMYPSPSILRQAIAAGIPLILTSDAHRSDTLDFYFTQAHDELIQAGAKTLDTLYHGFWVKKPLL